MFDWILVALKIVLQLWSQTLKIPVNGFKMNNLFVKVCCLIYICNSYVKQIITDRYVLQNYYLASLHWRRYEYETSVKF